MATAAGYLVPGKVSAVHRAFSWLIYRITVYVGIVTLSGLLFLSGAGIYSYFWTAEISSRATSPSKSTDAPLGSPATPIPSPSVAPEDLVVGNQFSTSNIIGLEIFDSSNEPIGAITDLVLARSGNAEAIVVSLNGYWLTRKYIIIPFKKFTWDFAATADPTVHIIQRGKVPYSRERLQGLPPIGDPFVPLHPTSQGLE